MWIHEYINMMYPVNIKNMRMEEAMLLKYKNIPSSLFKYRAVNSFSLQNLEEDTVWVTTADKYNDPYDCALTLGMTNVQEKLKIELLKKMPTELKNQFNISFDEKKIEELAAKPFNETLRHFLAMDKIAASQPQFINEFIDKFEEILTEQNNKQIQTLSEQMQKGTLIACFSEVNDSILMWSHYANNHKGFCIEYDFKQCNAHDVLTRMLQPVIYTNELFDFTKYLRESMEDYNNLIGTYSAIIKSSDWAYEKEWRLAFPIGGDGINSFNRQVPKPRAIYLGSKITPEDKKKVTEIATRRGIEVYKMQLRPDEFKLVSVKF